MNGWWASEKRRPRIGARIRVQSPGIYMLPELQDEPVGVVEGCINLCLLLTRSEVCYLIVRYADGIRWVPSDDTIFVLKREVAA